MNWERDVFTETKERWFALMSFDCDVDECEDDPILSLYVFWCSTDSEDGFCGQVYFGDRLISDLDGCMWENKEDAMELVEAAACAEVSRNKIIIGD